MSLLSPDRCSSFVRAVRPFLRPGLQVVRGIARRPSRLAVAIAFVPAPPSAGHVLTAPSTVPRLRRLGRRRSCPRDLEAALLVENRPGDAGKLVGERDRKHAMMQPLLGSFDPRLEPVALPALRPDQNHPGRLDEQDAQVAIAALRYFADGDAPFDNGPISASLAGGAGARPNHSIS
jgi:hypothetical protein